jgi:acyl-coenzyme A synthetase/AMP-(fatty) acid ligase
MDADLLPELLCRSGWRIETNSGTVTGAQVAGLSRRHAAGLSRYEPGGGVFISLRAPVDSLSVALGAWWCGLRVAFARADSPLPADQQARAVGAAVWVASKPTAATERARSAGIRVVLPAELAGPPVTWGPRCTSTDHALDTLSSGTTGAPKCVVFTHGAIAANACALAEAMAIDRGDRLWTGLPHGLPGVLCTVLLAAACRSATTVLCAPGNAADGVRSLRAAGPSVVYGVPEIYQALGRLAPPERVLIRGVRLWLSSSGVLSPALFDLMRSKWDVAVRSFYCGSEFGTATFNDSDDDDVLRSSVGRQLPTVSIDTDTSRSGPAAVGRVRVHGALVGCGYRTADGLIAFPGSGVVTTDLGTVDGDGFLRLHGRTDGHIQVGAEVVDPRMIETHVESLGGVARCEVVPRSHPLLGQVVEARVTRIPGADVTERAIILGCRERGLAGGWVPRRVTWTESVQRRQAGNGDTQ